MTDQPTAERGPAGRSAGLVKAAALFGAGYLFLSINPYLLWKTKASLFYLALAVAAIPLAYLLGRSGNLVVSEKRVSLFLAFLLLTAHVSLPLFGHEFQWAKILLFFPALAIVFFGNAVHDLMVSYFRKLILFFAFFAVLLTVLFMLGVEPAALPHYVVEGFTVPMERGNHFYRVYGLAAAPTNVMYRFHNILFLRATGPFMEPGHFAVILGLVVSMERLMDKRISKLLVLAGILTFSPAFLMILAALEVRDIVFGKRILWKRYLAGAAILAAGLALAGPAGRESLWSLTIGRTFGKADRSVLDDRASARAIAEYDQFRVTPKVLVGEGGGGLREIGMLSDIRGFVFSYGYAGVGLSALIFGLIFRKTRRWVWAALIPVVVLVYAHRAWMLASPYVYVCVMSAVFGHVFRRMSAARENRTAGTLVPASP